MERRIPSPLTVGFPYAGTIADGDVLTIGADRTVRRLAASSEPIVGQVYSVQSDRSELVAVVPFSYHRNTRLAGAPLNPGYFVWGPNNTVLPYVPATPARCSGMTVGPVAIVTGTNDAVKLKAGSGDWQTATLTAGPARSFAQVAEELNAVLVGIIIELDADGHLNPVCTHPGKSIEIGTVTHDAYTELGWDAGVYEPTFSSHDPAFVGGIVVTSATEAGQAVETLEY